MLEGLLRVRYERFLVARSSSSGAVSRRIWSSSAARSGVIESTESPARRLAFVSPSVTYGPEAPLLQDDRLLADGILPQLLERRGRRAAAALARLGELRERLIQRDREHLLLVVE